MTSPPKWTDRAWTFRAEPASFPSLLERLRGTPARAAGLVMGATDEALTHHPDGGWSAKQHIGHLDDLGPLDDLRLEEFLAGAATLTNADPANTATEDAGHDQRPVGEIIAELRRHRGELVRALERLEPVDWERTSTHPRLGQPMRLIDWVEFVAEHDDHHLAKARAALATAAARATPRGAPGAPNLNQVTLSVTDLPASSAFYERLGLTKIVDAPHYARFECFADGPSLSLHVVDAPVASGVTIYFEVDDVDASVARLRSAGIDVDDPVDQRWLWREARLTDPDGHSICVYHAGSNRLYPPWRVTRKGAGAGDEHPEAG